MALKVFLKRMKKFLLLASLVFAFLVGSPIASNGSPPGPVEFNTDQDVGFQPTVFVSVNALSVDHAVISTTNYQVIDVNVSDAVVFAIPKEKASKPTESNFLSNYQDKFRRGSDWITIYKPDLKRKNEPIRRCSNPETKPGWCSTSIS